MDGRPRRILLSEVDARLIAKAVRLQTKEFAKPSGEDKTFTLEMKKAEGKCLFLKDGGCKIYEARPLICRCFPFWIEREGTWKFIFKASDECPGIGEGRSLKRSFFVQLLKQSLEAHSTNDSQDRTASAFE